MAWVAVDKDGEEYIYSDMPERYIKTFANESEIYVQLPKGSIKKLIGLDLTWTDEPVELEEDKDEK